MSNGGGGNAPNKGKLIVIDGADGVGKATQVGLLVDRLGVEGFEVGSRDFPRYETLYGKMVRAYLDGEFGDPTKIPAKLACAPYALDRAAARDSLLEMLYTLDAVVVNRYTPKQCRVSSGEARNNRRTG